MKNIFNRIFNFFLNERNILVLITINALIIFTGGIGDNIATNIIDASFTLLFITELIIKLVKNKDGYFRSKWNIFDFILIMISIPSLGILFGFTTTDLSMLLALRTLRVFKVFRFFKFVPNINNILSSIQRALRTSILVIIAFTVLIFSFSILNNYLFSDYEEFSNPGISLYNTIKVFTVEGWSDVPESIADKTSEEKGLAIKGYFTILLILGGIFGLSFVNAILVDTMTMDNNNDLERKIDELNDKIDKYWNENNTDDD